MQEQSTNCKGDRWRTFSSRAGITLITGFMWRCLVCAHWKAYIFASLSSTKNASPCRLKYGNLWMTCEKKQPQKELNCLKREQSDSDFLKTTSKISLNSNVILHYSMYEYSCANTNNSFVSFRICGRASLVYYSVMNIFAMVQKASRFCPLKYNCHTFWSRFWYAFFDLPPSQTLPVWSTHPARSLSVRLRFSQANEELNRTAGSR